MLGYESSVGFAHRQFASVDADLSHPLPVASEYTRGLNDRFATSREVAFVASDAGGNGDHRACTAANSAVEALISFCLKRRSHEGQSR